MVDRPKMLAQLVLHEGCKLHVYTDTKGNFTLGIGYNLTARGPEFFQKVIGRTLALGEGSTGQPIITSTEAGQVCLADIDRVETAVRAYFPEYDTLDEVRQRVIVDLTFNMGTGVLTFQKAIAAARKRDWTKVSMELYRSQWATQVDDGEGGKFGRADRLAQMILTGTDYTR